MKENIGERLGRIVAQGVFCRGQDINDPCGGWFNTDKFMEEFEDRLSRCCKDESEFTIELKNGFASCLRLFELKSKIIEKARGEIIDKFLEKGIRNVFNGK